MRRKGLTSVDLAKLAGVSSATVSRAFSPDGRINPRTRERVLAIAKDHEFRPNAVARSLNNRQSRLVALVFNTVANPAEAEELDMLIHRLQANQRMPMLLCCADHQDRGQLMRIASAYQVDHVVLYSDMISVDEAIDVFRSAKAVIVSAEPHGKDNVSQILVDASAASAEVVDRLVTQGRRRFGYLSGRSSSHVDKRRLAWFSAALALHGLAFEKVAHGNYSYESGYKEAVLLMRQPICDVVICANDLMAVGVLDAARALGLVVPDDIAVVGHDGVDLGNWDCHRLTTITTDRAGVCDAVAEIIEMGEASPPVQRTFSGRVRWGSTAG